MANKPSVNWKNKIISPDIVLSKIKPGSSIFLSTGVAEPRTLIKHLMSSDMDNLRDLEFIQLLSFGDALPVDERYSEKYRLKTFFSGWVASEAITAGRIDLIPSRFSRIPRLFQSGVIDIDVAFLQVTPPNEKGFASLGVAVDVARHAIEQASLVVCEINESLPFTLGDTFIDINEIDYLVESVFPPIYFPRWPTDISYDKLAANVASVIEDGSCLSFFTGPLFECLPKHLATKKSLGIHSFLMTDALMELIKTGSVTNRLKTSFRGKSVAAYAQGTPDLMEWLDHNPLIEFQGIDILTDSSMIGQNDRYTTVIPARKIGLTGDIALPAGKGNVTAGPGVVLEAFAGAALSHNGRTIVALPSRNRYGKPNILLSVASYPNQLLNSESLDLVATDYGVASLRGRTLRERALALIDIAHPEDRGKLVQEAKAANILYGNQLYLTESGYLYPNKYKCIQKFEKNLSVLFRAIKPSDENNMRKLFYRFSAQTIYSRYFSPIKVMPHGKTQEYVNIDYKNTMSIVGIIEEEGTERIIAEGRYVLSQKNPFADVALIIDEDFQGMKIGTFLFDMLAKIAQKEGIKGFLAHVLPDNKSMITLLKKAAFPATIAMHNSVYELTIPFHSSTDNAQQFSSLLASERKDSEK